MTHRHRPQTLKLDSARQSPIEALRSERGGPSPRGKGDEEDRLGKVVASPNSKFEADGGGSKSLLLLLCVLVLFILGLSMVFNTTSAEVLDRALTKSTHHAVVRQLLYAILGGVLAAGVWFLGFDEILRLSGFFLGFVTFLLVLVFIPGIGQCLNGAHRWLGIGSYSFKP